jgi:uncharacterized membrane protein YfcA
MAWLAALSGLVVGLSLATLGGGGSILTVPILVYLLGQDPHAATTGSLLVVGATALSGAAVHGRAGRVRAREGLTFGLVGVPGALVGARLSAGVDGHLLLSAFTAVMLAAAVAMLLRWRRTRAGEADRPPTARPRRSVPLLVATASGVGLLTGFLGVGGGFLIVPALVLVLALPMPEAVGTSLLVITLTSTAALAVRAADGIQSTVDWLVVGWFAAAAIAATLVGGRLVARTPPARLTAAFAVLLLAVAAYTGVRSLPASW